MKRKIILFTSLILLIIGCGEASTAVDASPSAVDSLSVLTPTAVSTAPRPLSTATPLVEAPTLTPPPLPTVEPLPLPTERPAVEPEPALEAELLTQTEREWQTAVSTDLPNAGFDGLYAEQIGEYDGQPVWIVHSVGFRPFDPSPNHLLGAYTQTGDRFTPLGTVELTTPDILESNFLRAVAGENGRLWVTLDSFVGAHSGCVDVLRIDNAGLTHDITHCAASPYAAGQLTDRNQDGRVDIALNLTDYYIFCYACGVTLPSYNIRAWNGTAWEDVNLTRLTIGDAAFVDANNRAVTLAEAGLWQEASAQISELDAANPVVRWNQIIIQTVEEDMLLSISEAQFPLLQHVFYGDYASAVEILRPYDPIDLFRLNNNPIIEGSSAMGYQEAVTRELDRWSTSALSVKPNLAEAYFLRGWGLFLTDPANPAVLADIEQAAMLAPDDPLFAASAAFLRGE